MRESHSQGSTEGKTLSSQAPIVGEMRERELKPWFRLVLYLFMIVFGGIIYWGWYGIQTLLYKAGSFEDLCDGESDISYVQIGSEDYVDCGKRKRGINNLFTLAYSAHFVFTLVNGFLLDNLGPRYSYMICQITNFLSWILIGIFPKNPYLLKLAFFLIGSTAEGLVMPLITVSYFFQKHQSLIICITGSAISVSYVVPLILAAIYSPSSLNPNGIYLPTFGYAIFGNLMCFILGYLFVHNRLPKEVKESEEGVELSTVVGTENRNVQNKFEYFKRNYKSIIKSKKTVEYVLLVLSTTLFLKSMEFINKAQKEILTTSDGWNGAEILKYIHFLTFIPTPLFGVLMEKLGPEIVNMMLYLFAFLFFAFVVFDEYLTKKVAIAFYFLSASSCISGLYSHVSRRFPSSFFGTLSGVAMMISGVFTLTNIPLYNMGTNKTDLPIEQRFLVPLYILMVRLNNNNIHKNNSKNNRNNNNINNNSNNSNNNNNSNNKNNNISNNSNNSININNSNNYNNSNNSNNTNNLDNYNNNISDNNSSKNTSNTDNSNIKNNDKNDTDSNSNNDSGTYGRSHVDIRGPDIPVQKKGKK